MTVKIWYVRLSLCSHVLTNRKIKCRNCANFFHSQCYGYSEGTVGANFECYDCLLADSEPDLLFQKIYPLCTRRRMVYYLQQHGFIDTEGLCQYMSEFPLINIRAILITLPDLNQQDTQDLVDSLKTEGIIKNCSRSSEQPFRFADLDRLRAELFNPSKHIAHTKLVSTLPPFPELSDLPIKSIDPL